MTRLKKFSVDRQFGEGEKVSIHGTDPALNRVFIDGHSIASADWGGNPADVTGRTFNYALLAPEIIGQAKVYKNPEAWIDEGSIGGTVIIETRISVLTVRVLSTSVIAPAACFLEALKP